MIFYGIKFSSVSKLVIQWFYTLYHDSCVKITFWIFFFFFFFFFLIFHVIFMPKHTCTALKLHTTKVNWPCYTPVSWWPFILHALGAWCSLGHGRKFIKDAPSACRINGHINHFDMKLVMFLINVEKKPRLLFWCIFFLKFCLKK